MCVSKKCRGKCFKWTHVAVRGIIAMVRFHRSRIHSISDVESRSYKLQSTAALMTRHEHCHVNSTVAWWTDVGKRRRKLRDMSTLTLNVSVIFILPRLREILYEYLKNPSLINLKLKYDYYVTYCVFIFSFINFCILRALKCTEI